jgi:hypothetical protein
MGLRSALVSISLAVTAIVAAIAGTPRAPSAPGGQGAIRVGPNIQVSTARAKSPHGEVILAADPGNPARLLAGSMIEEPGPDGSTTVVAYSSSDGGKTWELALVKKPAREGRNCGYFDPVVAFGPRGVAHLAALRVTPDRAIHLEIVSSPDGGKTWGTPFTDRDHLVDRPFLAVDCTRGEFRGRIYCGCKAQLRPKSMWKPTVFISHDGGATFGPPIGLDMKNLGPGLLPGPCVVLPNGMLALAYSDRIASANAGRSFGIWLRRSWTGGQSFLDEQHLFNRDDAGQNLNILSMPVLAADPGSKAFADRLYLAWAEKTPAGVQVMLTLSKDKGATWSAPRQLSEQPAAGGAGGKSYHAVRPAIAVNRQGVVGVSWYDTRGSRDGKPTCNVRFRASCDGGATWLPSVQVSDAASDFEINDRDGGVLPRNWLGETAGLAADAAGIFHPLWVDNRTGVKQVFTAEIRVGKGPPEK